MPEPRVSNPESYTSLDWNTLKIAERHSSGPHVYAMIRKKRPDQASVIVASLSYYCCLLLKEGHLLCGGEGIKPDSMIAVSTKFMRPYGQGIRDQYAAKIT